MRTSDWSSVIVSMFGRCIPKNWRGHRRDREVRSVIIDAVHRATLETEEYDNWVKRFDSLHRLALQGEVAYSAAQRN